MIRKNEILIMGGALYIAPSMSVVDLHNEGLLCTSFGDANAAGKELNVENEWDF